MPQAPSRPPQKSKNTGSKPGATQSAGQMSAGQKSFAKPSPARAAALAMLSTVLDKRRPLEAVLGVTDGLEEREAHFARRLTSETLRRLGQLEALIGRFLAKPLARHKSGPALEILLLGACELIFLDAPAHAAVDAANRLAAADDKAKHFKPLINAVLRKIASEGKAMTATQDISLNLPDWLWSRWCEFYGEDTARAIIEAQLKPAPLDIVGTTPPGFAAEYGATALFGPVLRLAPQRVDTLPGYAEGGWWVQDAAATLPVKLLGDVAGKRVLDLCAAPGGKTAELATAGAIVTAVEREPVRLERLRENLARLKLEVETIAADLRDLDLEPAPLVLIDAPCSATGTLRRHPELPWIKGASDITLCAGVAGELLDAAAQLTAPGGLLVFAVCSLEAEEGPEQAAAFLHAHPEFSLVPATADELYGHDEWLIDGAIRTLPCHLAEFGGMDGFYAARFRKQP